MNEKLKTLADLGQSIWLDDLRREYLESGDLAGWIALGLRGETSNPSIFDRAISEGQAYQADLAKMAERGLSAQEIAGKLMEADVRAAADTFRPVYEATNGTDGYVSIEVNPHLANDTEGTLDEARRLFDVIDRPNIMVKVPATEAGIPAVRELIGEGRNINITLIFSLDQYEAVVGAYFSGLERFAEKGGELSEVASVASFFVSRIDARVDQRLDELQAGHPLRGKIGIANAKTVYRNFRYHLSTPRWMHLEKAGARPQRPLWASTSVKDPTYPETMYMDALIGADTVNTVPLETLQAFLDQGKTAATLFSDRDKVQQQLIDLNQGEIDLEMITDMLLEEGVQKFSDAYDALLDTVENARAKVLEKSPAA